MSSRAFVTTVLFSALFAFLSCKYNNSILLFSFFLFIYITFHTLQNHLIEVYIQYGTISFLWPFKLCNKNEKEIRYDQNIFLKRQAYNTQLIVFFSYIYNNWYNCICN